MSTLSRLSLWYNFSYLGIIQVMNFILSLLVIPYVIRVAGAEGFGIIAVAQVLIFYLSVAVDYGFNRTAIRDVALFRHDTHKLSKIFSTVIVSRLFLSMLAFVILVILVVLVPLFRAHSSLYLLAFSFVLGQAVLMNWFFQGLEKMKFTALASLFSRVLFVLMVFVFIKRKEDIGFYLFFMGAGNIVAGLGSMIFCRKMFGIRFLLPSRKEVYYELKEGWPVTVSNLSMTTIQYIGIFILRLFTNDLVVGYYSIAEKIYFAMKLMLDVFSQAAYPRVCILMTKGLQEVKSFFRHSFVPFLGMVLAGSAGIFLFAPRIIEFFAHSSNDHAAFILRGLCVAVLIVCLNIPACLVLLAGDHKKQYLRIFSLGMIVCLVVNILLASRLSATGTMYAVLVTEFFITAGLYLEVVLLYRNRRAT